MPLRALVVCAAVLLIPAFVDAQDLNCAQCHEQSKKLEASVHGPLTCAGCHSDIDKYPHPKNPVKPQCSDCHSSEQKAYDLGVHGRAAKRGNELAPNCAGCHGDVHEVVTASSAAFRKSVPETCGGCHAEVAEQYLASVHGKAIAAGNFDAASCTDCHGEHTIVSPRSPESLVSAQHIRETCASCHQDVRLARRYQLPLDRVTSFDQSFHGLAAKAGSQTVANCASCHGIHNILPSSDPKSTINQKNLPETCGKCHPGAGTRFTIGTIHFVPGHEPAALGFVRTAYLILIPMVVGYMLLHHAGDFIRKLWRLRLRRTPVGPFPTPHRDPEAGVRMHRFERFQHLWLIISFTLLVWSGFALRYPDSWWAQPVSHWEAKFPVRGTVHRTAAVIMLAVGLMHAVSLIVSGGLRRHWKTLWPRRKDVPEFLFNTAYSVGLTNRKPLVSSHSYIEKIEYWAVVWGTAVMAITGFMLWLNRYTLQWIPKLWLDVAASIHFYEAVLATLAIVIWHFYMVIFDPEVYPMDPAWIHGVSVRRRVREAHEEEDEAPSGEAERESSEA
jgi:cytochrome b subunit of formate dehydrogenase